MAIRNDWIDTLTLQRGLEPGTVLEARRHAEVRGLALGDAIALGLASDDEVARSVAESFGLRCREDLRADAIDLDLCALLPVAFAHERGVLLLKSEGISVWVAIADPADLHVLDDLRMLFAAPVLPVVVSRSTLTAPISAAYRRLATTAEKIALEF